MDAAFAEAGVAEAAWMAARHAPPATAATPNGRPARRLPPRPAWFTADTTPIAAHRAAAAALGPAMSRAR